jgi:hypothetical protein
MGNDWGHRRLGGTKSMGPDDTRREYTTTHYSFIELARGWCLAPRNVYSYQTGAVFTRQLTSASRVIILP